MSAAGATPSSQLQTLGTHASAQAAVANAAAAAQTQGGVFPGVPGGAGGSLAAVPFGSMNMPNFPGFMLQQQMTAQQQQSTPGKGAKKQKGLNGAPLTPSGATSTVPQNFSQFLSGNMQYPFNLLSTYGTPTSLAQAGGGGGADGMPRGRWTEEMTFRLIDLRSKMDNRFRTVARPDKLWHEITTNIGAEFSQQLPKQSTKDKWKNLRSSFRLINQGKHPSHYSKDTWPFYSAMERYIEQSKEYNPDAMPMLNSNVMGDSSHEDTKLGDESDGEGEEGEDDEDDEEGGEKKQKRGKKRDRATANATSTPSASTTSSTTPAATSSTRSYYQPSSGVISQEVLSLIRPKDVTRREKDWSSGIRALNAHMTSSIQDSHQALMQLTRSYQELADRVAPTASVRRSRADAQVANAQRLQDVIMSCEVVRAEMKHLPLLVHLFDQYRVFYQQQSDLELASQFLTERLQKNDSAIFIALPILSQYNAGEVVPLPSGASGSSGAASASNTGAVEGSLNEHENVIGSSLVSSKMNSSTLIGTSSSSTVGRLPTFAYGFGQLYPSFSSVRCGRHWIVNDLFVAPSARHKGVGSLLLAHIKKFGQDTGAVSMELSTGVNNVEAQSLYSRLEWRKQTEFVTFKQTF